MFPCPSANNRPYPRLGSTKQNGYGRFGHPLIMQGADFDDVARCKISSIGMLSQCLSAFLVAVFVVSGRCIEKKVIRITTRRVITFMTYALPGRNCSIFKSIGKSMRFLTSFGCRIKGAISIPVSISEPIPALVFSLFINLTPKSFNGVCPSNGILTGIAATWADTQSNIWFCSKIFTTIRTLDSYWHNISSFEEDIAHCPLAVKAIMS